jgi:GGDEF domain-containing protein
LPFGASEAAYPEHGSDLTELREAADVALYGAKRGGRDLVGEPRWDDVGERAAF